MSSRSQPRLQATIADSVQTAGYGFITGAYVTLHFHPAPPHHGIAFKRSDLPDSLPVPALIDFAAPRNRRTAIARHGVTIELTEHVLATLAACRIDNCLVEIDAAEPPGGDGSSQLFVDALSRTSRVEQDAERAVLHVKEHFSVSEEGSSLTADPSPAGKLIIEYDLDYGDSPIPVQSARFEITPETFRRDIAFARTFILETEIEQLRALGYGKNTTEKDLLVFGKHGILKNAVRKPNECARHKLLDCIGDFALLGCDIVGEFKAKCTGHRLNRDLVRILKWMSTGADQQKRAA